PATQVSVELNGEVIGTADALNDFVYPALNDGDLLRLVAIPEPPGVAAGIAAATAFVARRWSR
ncbi:MAG: hypothetical protein AAF266_13865, partial [Planctomycetota bacterium]